MGNSRYKFRAWEPRNKVMVLFDLAKIATDRFIAANFAALASNTHEAGEGLLMQFTGLKDKNGVEIYFDDVVKVYGYGDLHVKGLGDLCELVDSAAENNIGEILGNVHEQPELLTN